MCTFGDQGLLEHVDGPARGSLVASGPRDGRFRRHQPQAEHRHLVKFFQQPLPKRRFERCDPVAETD
jgi:hypothetical protein